MWDVAAGNLNARTRYALSFRLAQLGDRVGETSVPTFIKKPGGTPNGSVHAGDPPPRARGKIEIRGWRSDGADCGGARRSFKFENIKTNIREK